MALGLVEVPAQQRIRKVFLLPAANVFSQSTDAFGDAEDGPAWSGKAPATATSRRPAAWFGEYRGYPGDAAPTVPSATRHADGPNEDKMNTAKTLQK